MIKVTSKLYIHFLTLAMFAVCVISRRAGVFLFIYAVMIVHEAAHAAAAAFIGLKTDRIVFYPYGVNLKLKNKFVHSIADETILYLSGPFVNCVFALVSLLLYRAWGIPELQVMYTANIMLFVSNMLPVCPLDGGIILKKILAHFIGSKAAGRIMTAVSAVLAAAVAAAGVYAVFAAEFNFSVIMLAAFLICSLFTQNEKYDVDFVKELMFYTKKSRKKIRHIIVPEHEDLKKIASGFVSGRYGIVYLENDRGEITGIKTETEIMRSLSGK